MHHDVEAAVAIEVGDARGRGGHQVAPVVFPPLDVAVPPCHGDVQRRLLALRDQQVAAAVVIEVG